MPSLSVADEIKAATEAMERMAITKTSRFAAHAACVVPVSKTIGNALNTTEKVVTSVNAFVGKWNIVIDRLGFVMHALKPISEVCSIGAVNSFLDVITFLLDFSIRKVGVGGHLIHTYGTIHYWIF